MKCVQRDEKLLKWMNLSLVFGEISVVVTKSDNLICQNEY